MSIAPKKIKVNNRQIDDHIKASRTAIFFEAIKNSDRAAAIIITGFLDNELLQTLQHVLAPIGNEGMKSLLRENGPLSAFSDKILIAEAIGLIGERTKKNLNTIRQIRNEFSHNPKPINFDSQRISDLSKNLDPAGWESEKPFNERVDDFIKLIESDKSLDGHHHNTHPNRIRFFLTVSSIEYGLGKIKEKPRKKYRSPFQYLS